MFSKFDITTLDQSGITSLKNWNAIQKLVRDYNNLLEIADRDRQVMLTVIDRIGVRLDDIPSDPQAAGGMMKKALDHYEEDLAEQ